MGYVSREVNCPICGAETMYTVYVYGKDEIFPSFGTRRLDGKPLHFFHKYTIGRCDKCGYSAPVLESKLVSPLITKEWLKNEAYSNADEIPFGRFHYSKNFYQYYLITKASVNARDPYTVPEGVVKWSLGPYYAIMHTLWASEEECENEDVIAHIRTKAIYELTTYLKHAIGKIFDKELIVQLCELFRQNGELGKTIVIGRKALDAQDLPDMAKGMIEYEIWLAERNETGAKSVDSFFAWKLEQKGKTVN